MKNIFKKSFVLAMAILMFSTSAIMASEGFSDVGRDKPHGWAYDYITELSKKDIISGYPDGTFKPGNNITYLETMELIKGLVNPDRSEINKARSKWESVLNKYVKSDWAKDAVAVALEREIIKEKELVAAHDAKMLDLGTTAYINRLEISIYLGRALELKPVEKPNLTYLDKDEIGEYESKYLAALIETKALNPKGRDGYFMPRDFVRRSEVAKLFKYSYDWIKDNPLKGDRAEQSDKGIVIHTFSIRDDYYISYESGSKVNQLSVNKDTVIRDKSNNILQLSELDKLRDQEVEIKYYLSGEDRVATEIITDTISEWAKVYELVEYTDFNGKVKLKDLETNRTNIYDLDNNVEVIDGDYKDQYATNIKLGTKLVVEFNKGKVSKMTYYYPEEYRYEIVNINRNNIELYDSKAGTSNKYTMNNSTTVLKDGKRMRTADLRVGQTVDFRANKNDVLTSINIGLEKNSDQSGIYEFLTISSFNDKMYVVDQNGNEKSFTVTSKTNYKQGSQRNANLVGHNFLKPGDIIQIELNDDGTVKEVLQGNFKTERAKITKIENVQDPFNGIRSIKVEAEFYKDGRIRTVEGITQVGDEYYNLRVGDNVIVTYEDSLTSNGKYNLLQITWTK